MKSVFYIICDAGDGSQYLEWYRTKELLDSVVAQYESDQWGADFDKYSSGDGIQVKELKLPDSVDIIEFGKVNHIYWMEDEELEDD
jgi:hypothetical protein